MKNKKLKEGTQNFIKTFCDSVNQAGGISKWDNWKYKTLEELPKILGINNVRFVYIGKQKEVNEIIKTVENTKEAGLKDHEISELVTKLKCILQKKLFPICFPQCLRGIIEEIVIEYLEDNNLRIDKKK